MPWQGCLGQAQGIDYMQIHKQNACLPMQGMYNYCIQTNEEDMQTSTIVTTFSRSENADQWVTKELCSTIFNGETLISMARRACRIADEVLSDTVSDEQKRSYTAGLVIALTGGLIDMYDAGAAIRKARASM